MTESELTLARSLERAPMAIGAQASLHPLLHLIGGPDGLIPNACALLALSPTGLQTVQVLASGLLKLPQARPGRSAPNALVGLAMHHASRTSDCAYTIAHTRSFALRHGLHPAAIVGQRLPREQAAAALTETLCTQSADPEPADSPLITAEQRAAIALAVGFVAFLDTFCAATGVELEPETAEIELEVDLRDDPEQERKPSNRRDDRISAMRVARALPASRRLERDWLTGIPRTAPAAVQLLEETTGTTFDVLERLPHRRAMRSVAAVLRDNLRCGTTTIPVATKALAGLAFAARTGDEARALDAQRIASHHGTAAPVDLFEAVRVFARECPTTNDTFMLDPWLDHRTVDVLLLARAVAAGSAMIAPSVIERVQASLTSREVIDVVVWLSLQPMLSRLDGAFQPELTTVAGFSS